MSAATTRTSIYDLAQAYDIAFDFRNLALECDVLDTLCIEHGAGHVPKSVLDVCCGPGFHCIEYAKRGRRSVGLDINREMIQFAKQKALVAGVPVALIQGDMRDFVIATPVELAMCAMSSIHHLLTQDDNLAHLRCAARDLMDGGLYVYEADHPRDVFGIGESLKHKWESTRDGVAVISSWAGRSDEFDVFTQVATVHVTMEIATEDGSVVIEESTIPLRRLTYQEINLLIEKSGVFEPVAWLGSLEGRVPMTNEKESNRMIVVLRECQHTEGANNS